MDIHPAQWIQIVGLSGCGKTTVLRILTAFERPAAGTILWNGTPLENVPGPVLKSSVIHVAQTPAMVAATVHTNLHLSFGFRNHRGRPRPSAEQLRHLLGQMGMEMGYVLTMIFRVRHPAPVLAFYGVMIFSAAWIVRARISNRTVAFFLPTLASMLALYMFITYAMTALDVGVRPWWRPQYFLTLGGMVIGNSMNAVAIALEWFFDFALTKLSLFAWRRRRPTLATPLESVLLLS
ncbi:MAG: ABC transporter permease [Desulfosoma sp.]|uniref:ABC transporter permease n=1 Tax=Desulfosoma sp. TaxID=2603217 RepID=UPI004049F70B